MLNKIFGIQLIACCFLVFSSCGNTAEKSPVPTKPRSAQTIFEENCTSCHGSDGKLCALGAKDLSRSTLDRSQAVEIITNGKSTMAPFGSMLSNQEIDAVAEYIQTLKK